MKRERIIEFHPRARPEPELGYSDEKWKLPNDSGIKGLTVLGLSPGYSLSDADGEREITSSDGIRCAGTSELSYVASRFCTSLWETLH